MNSPIECLGRLIDFSLFSKERWNPAAILYREALRDKITQLQGK